MAVCMLDVGFRDHFLNAPSQWEKTLQCNVVTHWLGSYTKWSLGLCIDHNSPSLVRLHMTELLAINGLFTDIYRWLNSSPGQNGCHFTDNIFRCIFVNENFCFLIKSSIKFVPKGPIDNNPTLVLRMAWRQTGNKPLSQPMLTRFTDAYMRH